MDIPPAKPIPTDPRVNLEVYMLLSPEQARHQLEHIDDSRVREIVVCSIVMLLIAYAALALRMMSRALNKKGYKTDDWIMIAALIAFSGFAATILLSTLAFGGGRHLILLEQPIKFAQAAMGAECLYATSICLVKLSTLFVLSHTFPSKTFRWTVWAIGIFVFLNSAVTVFVTAFQCRPIHGAWNPTIPSKCIRTENVYMVTSGLNVGTDLALLIAPLPQLWKLQLPRRARIELIGIFGMGGFVTIVSALRLPSIHKISLQDGSWTDVQAAIYSIIEVSLAIVCGCAITYRPLFNWLFITQRSTLGPLSYPNPNSRSTREDPGFERQYSTPMRGNSRCNCGDYCQGHFVETWQAKSDRRPNVNGRASQSVSKVRYVGTYPTKSPAAASQPPQTQHKKPKSIPIQIHGLHRPEDLDGIWKKLPPPPYGR